MNKRLRKKYFKKLGVWGKGYDAIVIGGFFGGKRQGYHGFSENELVKVVNNNLGYTILTFECRSEKRVCTQLIKASDLKLIR